MNPTEVAAALWAGFSWAKVWPWLTLLALLFFWMLGAHNRLMALRASIFTAFGGVDAVVKTRSQVVVTLLTAVTDPLRGEQAALDAAGQAQATVQTALDSLRPRPADALAAVALREADAALASHLARLVALVEQHAELCADPSVAEHLQALRELAPRWGFARQGYNDAGARYNAALQQFPTRLLRSVFGFGPASAL